jgi:hypothetical protein
MRFFLFAFFPLLSLFLVPAPVQAAGGDTPIFSALLSDGTRATVEAIAFSREGKFPQNSDGTPVSAPPSKFPPDTSTAPLPEQIKNADGTYSDPFSAPALWVWVSLKNPETGEYLKTLKPWKFGLYDTRWGLEFDESDLEYSIARVARIRGPLRLPDGRVVFGLAWPLFHCPTERFFLLATQDRLGTGCILEVPNPAISQRIQAWAQKAESYEKLERVCGDLTLVLRKGKDKYGNDHSFRLGLVRLLRQGKDVTKEYDVSTEALDAWGFKKTPPVQTSSPALAATVRFWKKMDNKVVPTQILPAGLSRPEAGQILPLPPEINTTFDGGRGRLRMLLGRGIYRVRNGEILGGRALSPQEEASLSRGEQYGIFFYANFGDFRGNEILVKTPAVWLQIENASPRVVAFRNGKGRKWETERSMTQTNQSSWVPLNWDAAGKLAAPLEIFLTEKHTVTFNVKTDWEKTALPEPSEKTKTVAKQPAQLVLPQQKTPDEDLRPRTALPNGAIVRLERVDFGQDFQFFKAPDDEARRHWETREAREKQRKEEEKKQIEEEENRRKGLTKSDFDKNAKTSRSLHRFLRSANYFSKYHEKNGNYHFPKKALCFWFSVDDDFLTKRENEIIPYLHIAVADSSGFSHLGWHTHWRIPTISAHYWDFSTEADKKKEAEKRSNEDNRAQLERRRRWKSEEEIDPNMLSRRVDGRQVIGVVIERLDPALPYYYFLWRGKNGETAPILRVKNPYSQPANPEAQAELPQALPATKIVDGFTVTVEGFHRDDIDSNFAPELSATRNGKEITSDYFFNNETVYGVHPHFPFCRASGQIYEFGTAPFDETRKIKLADFETTRAANFSAALQNVERWRQCCRNSGSARGRQTSLFEKQMVAGVSNSKGKQIAEQCLR